MSWRESRAKPAFRWRFSRLAFYQMTLARPAEVTGVRSDMLTAMETAAAIARIEQELKKYVHPLLEFGVREVGGRVELVIELKHKPADIHTYYLEIHPRDLASTQFPWTLQRMIFDGLHDYFIEMFVYTPQSLDNPDAPV